jgi:hypothetical protein
MLRRAFIVGSIVLWSLPARAPDDTASLQKLMEDTLAAFKAGEQDKAAALVKPMMLPNAATWFKKVFGDEVGAKLAADYDKMLPNFPAELGSVFKGRVRDGVTFVSVNKIESATDRNATGYQQQAVAAMKAKVPLYTVHFGAKPGGSDYTLWSFVYVDGQFRLAGKMRM